MSGTGKLALREGNWKFIPDLHTALGWLPRSTQQLPGCGLFDLSKDPQEEHNLALEHPETVKRLSALLAGIRTGKSD